MPDEVNQQSNWADDVVDSMSEKDDIPVLSEAQQPYDPKVGEAVLSRSNAVKRRNEVANGLESWGTALAAISLIGGIVVAFTGVLNSEGNPQAIMIITGGLATILGGVIWKAILHGIAEGLKCLGRMEDDRHG
jgi:hypothetical protein